MPKGLHCTIFRDEYRHPDCKFNGFKSVTLVGPGVAEIFEPSEDAPIAYLIVRNGWGETCSPMVSPFPPSDPDSRYAERHTMFGGAFIWTSDSRFPGERGRGAPLALHDLEG